MILFFRLVFLIVLFINYRIRANKLNVVFIYKIFIEIKVISGFFIKMTLGIVIFLIFNYNSYIYYSLGVRIRYGVVFSYALGLVIIVWVIWGVNNLLSMLRHYLPLGVEGVLKLFIPVIELLGVIIRPLTLAVRLATNIRCGHVVLLIFSYFVFNISFYLVFLIRVLLYGLYFIEFLVCVIQAYVFWRSIYIYLIEVEI